MVVGRSKGGKLRKYFAGESPFLSAVLPHASEGTPDLFCKPRVTGDSDRPLKDWKREK